MLLRICLAASAAMLAASCGDKGAEDASGDAAVKGDDGVAVESNGGETGSDPRGADAKAAAADNLVASMKFLEENASKDGVMSTDSGLQYKIVEEGPEGGATPKSTDLVQVEYVGTLKDGVEFDSSRAHGAAATFPLNVVIPGWTEGLQLMSEGDTYRFFVPPALAYGEEGRPNGGIGPNEALIFDVELIKVQSPERNLQAAKAFLSENAKKDGVTTTASGLQYEILVEGEAGGASPDGDDIVTVNYVGTLINGTEFDSSYARGEPATFPLNHVIGGWTEGVQLMSVGDKFRFAIPPELAYRERGAGPIGPNEALLFEVELLKVEDHPAETPAE